MVSIFFGVSTFLEIFSLLFPLTVTLRIYFFFPYTAFIFALPIFLPLICIFCLYFPFFFIDIFFFPDIIFHTTLYFAFFNFTVFFFPTFTEILVLLNIDFFDAALTVIEPLGTKHVINDIVTATAIAFFIIIFLFKILPPFLQ